MRTHRLSARSLWEREVRAGLHNQDREKPGTWALDGLWRAACWEAAAAEDRALSEAAQREGDLRMARLYLESAANKQARADLALASELGADEVAA